MIFWHLLVLTYAFEGDVYVSQIAFRDQPTCADAMDDIYPTILAEYPDSMAQCIKTDTASRWTIRPKSRPLTW
jgi:hypothetical protein